MQTLPICRATSAAWLVMPPNAVRKPSDAFMPRMSSGLVSWRHRIRLVSPLAASASASSAKNTTLPVAAPGPAGSPLASRRPSSIGRLLGGRQEDRPQQLVQRLRLHAAQRLLLRDQLLVHHLDGDAHAGEAGALAVAALEHVELAVLDRELDVLHVLVVLLELLADVEQLLVGLGQHVAERLDLLAACGCRRRRPRPARSSGTRRRTRSRRWPGRA